jgi:hypothetical protein
MEWIELETKVIIQRNSSKFDHNIGYMWKDSKKVT